MNLNLLLILPLITSLIILFCKGLRPVRVVAATGAFLQVTLGFALLYFYWKERSSGNTALMLFVEEHIWYAPLHIHYHTGVDVFSVAIILLNSFIVMAVRWVIRYTEQQVM